VGSQGSRQGLDAPIVFQPKQALSRAFALGQILGWLQQRQQAEHLL
jgi:hypothetical protein